MAPRHEDAGDWLELYSHSGFRRHADAVLAPLRTPSLRYSNHRPGAASAGHPWNGGATALALDRGNSTPAIPDANPVPRVRRQQRERVGGQDWGRRAAQLWPAERQRVDWRATVATAQGGRRQARGELGDCRGRGCLPDG